MIQKQGDIYEGNFENGVPKGKCRWYNNIAYMGEFDGWFPSTSKNNDKVNYIYKFLSNDNVLKGVFNLYSRQIKGALREASGDHLSEGQFNLDGQKHGMIRFYENDRNLQSYELQQFEDDKQ